MSLIDHEFEHESSELTYKVRAVAEVHDCTADFDAKSIKLKYFHIMHGIKDVTIYVKDLHEELYFELEEKMIEELDAKANEKEAA